MAISKRTKNGNSNLETHPRSLDEFAKRQLTCGPSDISFRMPLGSVLKQALVVPAIQTGMGRVAVNPEERELWLIILAAETLLGQDRHWMNFSRAFRAGKIGPRKDS